MTADSERYIQLQNVYREQAAQDIAAVTQHLHNILQTLGRVSALEIDFAHLLLSYSVVFIYFRVRRNFVHSFWLFKIKILNADVVFPSHFFCAL